MSTSGGLPSILRMTRMALPMREAALANAVKLEAVVENLSVFLDEPVAFATTAGTGDGPGGSGAVRRASRRHDSVRGTGS